MNYTQGFLEFIKNSYTCFHAVENMCHILQENGFIELEEGEKWNLQKGGKYFVCRNNSSIIAFNIGQELEDFSFNITASHTDSPTFKVKPNFEIKLADKYLSLNTEAYGGMICSSWFDRPLSIAGRAIVRNNEVLEERLVNIDEDLLVIPNVPIHLNREINSGYKYNLQQDTIPLMSLDPKVSLKEKLAYELNISSSDIIETDLYLYNRFRGCLIGANKEMILAPQIDDLECAYASLMAFINGYNKNSINVFASFDNEEVGSHTKQGAASTFMEDILKRINRNLGYTEEDYLCALSSSFMISCDNAHATHPNKQALYDQNNRSFMNEGVVIKYNASQSYTTDAVSASLFVELCHKAQAKYQSFTNRSDMRGGSTLGNIVQSGVSICSCDIGLPQLAMHSAVETAGVKDLDDLIKILEVFYNHHIVRLNKMQMKISQ